MKKIKILFYIIIYAMLIGGIMGIIKVLIPHMEWFNFRYLLGMGSTYKAGEIPIYAAFYGFFMAILEIISAMQLMTKKKIWIKFAIITLSINALGCTIAIFFGDIMAIGSLIIRFLAIYILIKFKNLYKIQDKNDNFINS